MRARVNGDLGAFRLEGNREVIFAGRENGDAHFTAICSVSVQGRKISLSRSDAGWGYMILKESGGDELKRYYRTSF